MKFQIKLLQNIILGHNKMFFFSFKDKKINYTNIFF